jgi:hypothetical protein
MGKPERFTLIAGILAFVVDILTLGTFAGAVAGTEIPMSLRIWIALAMFYGWFVASWVLVRRSFLRHQLAAKERVSKLFSYSRELSERPWSLDKRVLAVVSGIGCVLLPIALLFGYPILRQAIPNPQAVDQPLVLLGDLALFVGSVVVLFVFGAFVVGAVHVLMPVVYEEMWNYVD